MLFLGYQPASRVSVGSVHDAVPTRMRGCRLLAMARSFSDVADPVDALYALPPSQFTAARNALVKTLRAEKRRDEADAVKALKRPSVPAWALNQVARSSPDALQAVLDAGAAVVAAQRRALSGVRDAGLREASHQRREAIDAVFRLAGEVLRGAGAQPQTHRMAIAATLEAASVDAEAAARVTAGRLTNELPAPSGFGDVAGFSLVTDPPPAPTTPPAEDAPAGGQADDDDAAARAAAAEAAQTAALQAAQARRRADELAERAAEARRQAVRTEAEAQRMEERAAQVRARADAAALAADDVAADAEAAARKADAAQAEATAAAAVIDRTS